MIEEIFLWAVFLVFGLPVMLTMLWGIITLIFVDTPRMLYALWGFLVRPVDKWAEWSRDH